MARLLVSISIFLICCSCLTTKRREPSIRWQTILLHTSAYSSDPKSTGWELNKEGKPVYAYGPMKGKPKVVGKTASGVMARRGTIAADTDVFPFGTWIFVPGYGYGRVEDRGGAIKGNRIDLYFPTRKQALKWGRRNVVCRVLVSHDVNVTDRPLPYARKPDKMRSPEQE